MRHGSAAEPAQDQLLAERESCGYEVVQRLHEHGLTGVLEGTVYPGLARLERETWLTSRLVASASGPGRKYYRLTPAGHDALDAGATSGPIWEVGEDAVVG